MVRKRFQVAVVAVTCLVMTGLLRVNDHVPFVQGWRPSSNNHLLAAKTSSSFTPLSTLAPENVCLETHDFDFERRSWMIMGKGDRKRKKKKKKKKNKSLSSPTEPSEHQIRAAKAAEEREREREREELRWEKKREKLLLRGLGRPDGYEHNWKVSMDESKVKPLMIVDGYNVCYQWGELQAHMVAGNLRIAREKLVNGLEILSEMSSQRIEVVFDGLGRYLYDGMNYGNGYIGDDMFSESIFSFHPDVQIVFTGVGEEADDYIVGRCMEARGVTKGRLTGALMVATNDKAIRISAIDDGAICISAESLISQVKAAKALYVDPFELQPFEGDMNYCVMAEEHEMRGRRRRLKRNKNRTIDEETNET